MDMDRFSRLGIVVGLISLAFAIRNVPSDTLVQATFLIVLVTSLFVIVSLYHKQPND